jgi:hypothetical protein
MEDYTDKKFEDIEIGDKVSLISSFPKSQYIKDISEKEAEFLGFIIANGGYKKSYKKNKGKLTAILTKHKDIAVLEYYEKISMALYCSRAYRSRIKSRATKGKTRDQFMYYNPAFIKKYNIYNAYNEKVIPTDILNSSGNIKKAFLKGYYGGHELKNATYIENYKGFSSRSATLTMGLIFLFKEIHNLDYDINYSIKDGIIKYRVTLLGNSKYYKNSALQKYDILREEIGKGKSIRMIYKETLISRGFIRKVMGGYKPPLKHRKHRLGIPNNIVKKIGKTL